MVSRNVSGVPSRMFAVPKSRPPLLNDRFFHTEMATTTPLRTLEIVTTIWRIGVQIDSILD